MNETVLQPEEKNGSSYWSRNMKKIAWGFALIILTAMNVGNAWWFVLLALGQWLVLLGCYAFRKQNATFRSA